MHVVSPCILMLVSHQEMPLWHGLGLGGHAVVHRYVWIQTEMCWHCCRTVTLWFCTRNGLHDVPTGRKLANLCQLSKTRVHRDNIFQFASTNWTVCLCVAAAAPGLSYVWRGLSGMEKSRAQILLDFRSMNLLCRSLCQSFRTLKRDISPTELSEGKPRAWIWC